jgi:hypothetical protein
MDKDQITNLAEKIAQVISSESKPDLNSIQKNLDAINARLDRLESSSVVSNFKTQVSTPTHPSQERFAIAEAIVDSLFEQKEKACRFEPNGKPCDHCSMCNSRGF